MALAINGMDGNPFTTRDIDASSSNVVTTYHVITPSGSYVTGGDTLDLSTISGLIPSSSLPLDVDVNGAGNTAGTSHTALGNYYAIVQGATLAAYKLQMWTGGGLQLAAGAYPATVTNDRIIAKITWRKLI